MQLLVVDREGVERVLPARPGYSVMETIREGGIDELLALCGGCCSCATCHVFVDADWAARVGPAGEDEGELLDSSSARQLHSRLGCQITLADDMSGLRVTIAPED